MKAITPQQFVSVMEISDPLTIAIGLSGGSGTGKTYSALRIARGIAQEMTGKPDAKIGFVDTENRRALHYRQEFPEIMHFDMRAVDGGGEMVGFPPERWIEVIDAAEQADLGALVIDSFSHAWEGVNGVLDLQAQELERLTGGDDSKKNQRSQLAWAAVKPRYRRLIDRIVRAQMPMVICTRAKPVMQEKSVKTGWKEVNARATKTRRADIPWDPASDGDLMFEMAAMVILSPDAPGHPVYQVKVADQFRALFDARQPMSEDIGRALAKWSKGEDGSGRAQKEVMDQARAEARKGIEAFREWWNTEPAKAQRATLKMILPELQDIAKQADADSQASGDDPFGGDDSAPDGTGATPEERAELDRIAAELEAEGK